MNWSHALGEIVAIPALAVCTLPPDAAIPALDTDFYSLTRTPDELSLVVPESLAPSDATIEPGWRCLQVQGPLPFNIVGVLAGLTAPLAAAGISIFSLSTYQTDYLLIQQDDIERACHTLSDAGYTIIT